MILSPFTGLWTPYQDYSKNTQQYVFTHFAANNEPTCGGKRNAVNLVGCREKENESVQCFRASSVVTTKDWI